ncbi:MAG: hypothetical protein ACYTBJ_03570 [Planctomycetota bacterium]|jgi:hypothetical protein
MAHAYTPGLKVTDSITLRKKRLLPLKGDVVVEPNAAVKPDDVVARTFLPGEVHPLNVANMLNLPPGDVADCMTKKEKDAITKGEVVAETRGLFGMFKSRVTATVDGTIEMISGVTGQVLQRANPIPVEVHAYIRGRVEQIIEKEGVVVVAHGAFVQGIFGIGSETFGKLRMLCFSASEVVTPEMILDEHRDAVLVGGSLVTGDALKKAIATGVKAIVAGGFGDEDLRTFLGYDLGVAITGSEELGITLVVTEGFGRIDMAERTFELLKSREGMEASVNGATQIRAGVIRPEIIIPSEQASSYGDGKEHVQHGLSIGTPVRMIRQPYFGRPATVVGLPAELGVLESGSKARVLEVEFPDGQRAIVPRANVELIEE